MLRYAPLVILATVACADADPSLVDEASLERQRQDLTPTAQVDLSVPTVGGVSMHQGTTLDGAGLTEDRPEEPGVRPVAVVFVVDINADMADVGAVLNEGALVGLRSLSQHGGEAYYGLVAHADRRAHQLQPLMRFGPNDAREMFGVTGGLSTCSTLDDLQGWVDYDNPVFTSPSCWADELGRDPATALAFAEHMLANDAPPDAERAIVLLGGRVPEELVAGERRPDLYADPMPTWKRTDRFVSPDLLEAHALFVTEEIVDSGVRVFHVPLDAAVDNVWSDRLVEAGAERAWGESVPERIRAVGRFVDQLKLKASP